MTSPTPGRHGGKRAGAGRKPKPAPDRAQSHNVTFRPEHWRWLQSRGKPAVVLARLIDREQTQDSMS